AIPVVWRARETERRRRCPRRVRSGSTWSLILFSSAPPFQFFPQHIEEQHIRRPDQIQEVLGTFAYYAVAVAQHLAYLSVNGQVGGRAVAGKHLNLALIRNNHGAIGEHVRADGGDGKRRDGGKHDGPAGRERV